MLAVHVGMVFSGFCNSFLYYLLFDKNEDRRSCVGSISKFCLVLCLLGQSTMRDPTVTFGVVGGNGFKAAVETPYLDKTYR